MSGTFSGNTFRAKPAPVLEGSRCINCLGPYTGDTGKRNTRGSCRHHPGYLVQVSDWVRFTWSCCHQVEHFSREDLLEKHRLPLHNKSSFRQAVENLANRLYIYCGGYGLIRQNFNGTGIRTGTETDLMPKYRYS